MWHRGDRAKARDLFDLCAVADREPAAIAEAAPRFLKHGAAFLAGLQHRAEIARREFDEIDVIGAARSFERCLDQARSIIQPLLDRAGRAAIAPSHGAGRPRSE